MSRINPTQDQLSCLGMPAIHKILPIPYYQKRFTKICLSRFSLC